MFKASSGGVYRRTKYVSPLPPALFAARFLDAGAGAVNFTAQSQGSGTPTFTRASTAYALLSNGLYGLVASGTARSQYSPAGVYLGYLAEGARADVLGTTAAIRRNMTDIGWVATNMTVAATVGVDGVTASGARLTATGANATILFTPGLAGAVRTYSQWIKRITGTGAVSTTVDVADGYVAQTLTAAYAQYQTTSTSAIPVVGYKLATSGDVIDVDFNTLEAAPFANGTPIPVNVSKAADVLTYPYAGNANTAKGTAYAELTTQWKTAPANMVAIGLNNTSAPFIAFAAGVSTTVGMYDGTTVNQKTALTDMSTGARKRISSWGGSAMSITGDGATPATAAFDGTMGNVAIAIGTDTSGTLPWSGTIRNVQIFGTALSAAQLQAMTTP
jgi:hypothetical protein